MSIFVGYGLFGDSGGTDVNNLGVFQTALALTAEHPYPEADSYAYVVETTSQWRVNGTGEWYDTEQDVKAGATEEIQEAINNEVTERQAIDSSLQSQINANTANIILKADKSYTDSQDLSLQLAINTKVDKITGKGLSVNDFDNTYKAKLDNAPTDTNTVIQSLFNDIATKVSQTEIDNLKAQIGLVADSDSIVNTLFDIKQSLSNLGESFDIAAEFANRYNKSQTDALLIGKQNMHPNLTSLTQLNISGSPDKLVVVKSDGSGFDLSDASLSGNSGNYAIELLKTIKQTAFTSYIDIPLDLSNYTNIGLISSNLVSDSDSIKVMFRLLDSSSTPITSAIYHFAGRSEDSASNSWSQYGNGITEGTLTGNGGYNARNEANNGEIGLDVLITRPSANKYFKLRSLASYTDTNNRLMACRVFNEVKYTSVISKIRIYSTYGNIKGSLTLTGYKEKAVDPTESSTIPILRKILQQTTMPTLTKVENVKYYN